MSSELALPPVPRSRVALGLTAAAAIGRFELQTCLDCGAVQYPAREACYRCLSVRLKWQEQSARGELLARTTLFHSNEPYFQTRLPWAVGLIRLDCGPSVVAHLHSAVKAPGVPVRVELRLDRAGAAVLVAFPSDAAGVSDMVEDQVLSPLSCGPRYRTVLVTDATTETGMALVHALSAAGASKVYAGNTGKVVSFPSLSNVVPVSLDITDDASVAAAAASIGSDVEVLINTAEGRSSSSESTEPAAETKDFSCSALQEMEVARGDMEIHYFGLTRLAREFGARMRARNASQVNAVAWVNLLSIDALAGSARNASFAAAEAAALSLSQSLRAQMLPAGIRVLNVFAGPIEEGASALAQEIVAALELGLEDVYAGDMAKHVFARWQENPKGLERELAAKLG